MLAISTKTWHFRLYSRIRHAFGCEINKQSSICPYCQTIFWGSVFFVMSAPIVALGWLHVRVMRLIYSRLEAAKYHRVVDCLDKTRWLGLGIILDLHANLEKPTYKQMLDGTDKAPINTYMSYAIPGLCSISWWMLASLLGYLAVNCYIPSIAEIVYALFTIMVFVLTGIYMLFGLAGLLVYCVERIATFAAEVIWSIVTWEAMWLVIGYIVLYSTLATIVACTTSYFMVALYERSKYIRERTDALIHKYNGYTEAKAAAKERRAQEVLGPSLWDSVYDTCRAWTTKLCSLFTGIDIDISGRKAKLIGILAIVKEFAISAKRGVCPIVQFVDLESTDKPAD